MTGKRFSSRINTGISMWDAHVRDTEQALLQWTFAEKNASSSFVIDGHCSKHRCVNGTLLKWFCEVDWSVSTGQDHCWSVVDYINEPANGLCQYSQLACNNLGIAATPGISWVQYPVHPTQKWLHVCVCVCVCTCTCACTRAHVHMHVCIWKWMHVCIHVETTSEFLSLQCKTDDNCASFKNCLNDSFR